MAVTVQVIYPAREGTTFDHDYYAEKHMRIVDETIGPYLKSMVVTRGTAGAGDQPAPYHAVATFVFEDAEAMKAGMANARPLGEDLANFTTTKPDFLYGEVIA